MNPGISDDLIRAIYSTQQTGIRLGQNTALRPSAPSNWILRRPSLTKMPKMALFAGAPEEIRTPNPQDS
jgi:hypothetical protein